jgi:DNA-binding SARP family transcriptional activator
VDLRVLGPLEVWHDGARVPLPSVRQQRLLGVLALSANTVVPTQRLVDALWDDGPPATATKQVQNCVSHLRERLGTVTDQLIVTDGTGYRLLLPEEQLDLALFRRGVADAQELVARGEVADGVAVVRRALDLWRGDILAGIETGGIGSRTAGITEQRLAAIEQCVDWELSLGRHREVVDELTGLIALHPLREKPYVQLMTALEGAGRSAEALLVFHRLRAQLCDALGVEPGADARATYQRILCDEGEPPTTPAEPEPAPVETPVEILADKAATALATAVRRQWTIEAQVRSLNRPEPIHLAWSDTHRPVRPHAAATLADRGGLATLAGDFRQLPNRQLIVLGEPGAGKTVLALLLTLQLLEDLPPDEPVPVLLPLTSWWPDRDHLDTWLTRTLLEEYPMLARSRTYGPDAARRLVASGRVLPVLDGLDEMPRAHQAPAIDALDRAVAGGRPLVVTCRAHEYEHAVRTAGVIMSSAVVVELEPVTPAAAISYLTALEPVGSTRWQRVIEHIERQPDGPLARAFRTPLMVDIARTAYRDPATDPTELLDTERFQDATGYESHLLDGYVAAAYSAPPAPPERSSNRAQRHYDPRKAERWLAFLAGVVNRSGNPDLAWWHLYRVVPRWVLGLALGVPPAALLAVVGLIAANPVVSLLYGVPFAAAGYVTHHFGGRYGPRRARVTFRGTARRLLIRLATGALAGTALAATWSLPPDKVALVAAVFAVGFGAHALLDTPVDAEVVASPRGVVRGDFVAALWSAAAFAITFGVFYGLSLVFTNMVPFVLVFHGQFDLALALVAGVVGAVAFGSFTPGKLGRIAYFVAAAALGGNNFPPTTSAWTALAAGATFGVGVALVVLLSRANAEYAVTVLWLAACGRVPLRLLAFLEDAHRRGVLRQVGAVYQFRHARLAERLHRDV